MKLCDFSSMGDDIWHIYLQGCCNKAATYDEETETFAVLAEFNGVTCSMTTPMEGNDVDRCVILQLEVRGLRDDRVIDKLIKYLVDRYDMRECEIDLCAWQNKDCTGWVFSVANYKYQHLHDDRDRVIRTSISIHESRMIIDDVKMMDWEKFTTELLTLRLQLEPRYWGDRKEITYTKKFRGKPK